MERGGLGRKKEKEKEKHVLVSVLRRKIRKL